MRECGGCAAAQPPPGNVFWAWIPGIVLVAAVATAIVYLRRPGALQRVASGPEYIVPDAPGGVPDGAGLVPEGPGR